MQKTSIEWVKNPDGTQGYTWNPITGCNNQIDGLCKGGNFPCYAYKLAHGRLKTRYLANKNIAPYQGEEEYMAKKSDPFYPRFWDNRLILPYGKTPRGIFVCDMGELFGDWVPKEWVEAIFAVIKASPYNRYYLLTKQPQNLIKWSPFPENCWVGVTATANAFLTNALIGLAKVKARHKFLSFEPLLGSVGISDHMKFRDAGVDWVIIGAQTKPTVYPDPRWVHEIIVACRETSIPYFLKDNLVGCLTKEPPFYYPYGLPLYGKLRQEMPE